MEDPEVATVPTCEMSWLPVTQCAHCLKHEAWWEK